jgi:hypothetical protein
MKLQFYTIIFPTSFSDPNIINVSLTITGLTEPCAAINGTQQSDGWNTKFYKDIHKSKVSVKWKSPATIDTALQPIV